MAKQVFVTMEVRYTFPNDNVLMEGYIDLDLTNSINQDVVELGESFEQSLADKLTYLAFLCENKDKENCKNALINFIFDNLKRNRLYSNIEYINIKKIFPFRTTIE